MNCHHGQNFFISWVTSLLYVLRFISCCKPQRKMTLCFTVQELIESRNQICRLNQTSYCSFEPEIKLLKKNKILFQLHAAYISLGRIGAPKRWRLNYTFLSLSYGSKLQIILPKSHPAVNLIIHLYYKVRLHAGPQKLQATVYLILYFLDPFRQSVIRSRLFHCL